MGIFDEIKSSLKEIYDELAQSVIWRNRTVHCIVSNAQDGLELESGGFVSNATFAVKFREAELNGDVPEVGEIIVIGDAEFRINSVSNHRSHGQIEVQVKQRDQ